MHYFVRANGRTVHNNPDEPLGFVEHEPPIYPTTYFNYVPFCLEREIARIGWPDTGDLRRPRDGALAQRYNLDTVEQHVRTYLEIFGLIKEGVVLMPEPGRGLLYVGDIVQPYHYFHNVPGDPYECSHRVGVKWDVGRDGHPTTYGVEELGIHNRGGFWTRAFQVIENTGSGANIIDRLRRLRAVRRDS